MTIDDIKNRLARYGFKDEHGHPLENCSTYTALLGVIEAALAFTEPDFSIVNTHNRNKALLEALGTLKAQS